jgi:hypothetical protein
MPREVKAWGCIYSCGHRVSSSKASIARHERTCFANPERRACRTCRHDHFEPADVDAPAEKWCEVEARPEGKEAISDCEKWEAR